MNIFKKFFNILCLYMIKQIKNSTSVIYKVEKIIENNNTNNDNDKEFLIEVKVINKNAIFYITPEEILSNDKLVSLFSPLDVRTLTYLGYLCKNSPQYRILANKFAENANTLFIIGQTGNKKNIIKTAEELLNETDILSNMSQSDAVNIGYIAGMNQQLKVNRELDEQSRDI